MKRTKIKRTKIISTKEQEYSEKENEAEEKNNERCAEIDEAKDMNTEQIPNREDNEGNINQA